MAILNTVQLADHYGTHRQTIIAWVKRGMPYVTKGGRGKEYEFDSVKVADWKEEQAINNVVGNVESIDVEELKRRKLAAETTIAEIEAAKAKGEVSTLEEMGRQWADIVVTARSNLRQVPARCVSEVLTAETEAEAKEIMLAEIDEALNELAG